MKTKNKDSFDELLKSVKQMDTKVRKGKNARGTVVHEDKKKRMKREGVTEELRAENDMLRCAAFDAELRWRRSDA